MPMRRCGCSPFCRDESAIVDGADISCLPGDRYVQGLRRPSGDGAAVSGAEPRAFACPDNHGGRLNQVFARYATGLFNRPLDE